MLHEHPNRICMAALLFIAVLCFVSRAASWVNVSQAAYSAAGGAGSQPTHKNTVGVFCDPRNGDVYVAVAKNGLYRSSNKGVSFTKWANTSVGTGRSEIGASYNLHYPYTGRMAVINIDGGCGYTLDDGATWTKFTDIPRNWDVGDLDLSSPVPRTVVAIRHEGYPKESGHFYALYLSTDGGKTWEVLDSDDYKMNGVGVVNATTLVRSKYPLPLSEHWRSVRTKPHPIEYSDNLGQTWTKVSDLNPLGRRVVHYGSKLYWACREGVAVSADGRNWELVGSPLPDATWGPYFGEVESQMMVVAKDGFYITENAGDTWRKVHAWHTITDGWSSDGAYTDWQHFQSFAWDPVNNIIYHSSMCGSTMKLELEWELGPVAVDYRPVRTLEPSQIRSTAVQSQILLQLNGAVVPWDASAAQRAPARGFYLRRDQGGNRCGILTAE